MKKKNKAVRQPLVSQAHLLVDRMKYRNSIIPPLNVDDHYLIDIIIQSLFNGGDKIVLDIKKDILEKHKLPSDDNTINRLWDLLDAAHLINPVVGFGNSYKASITIEGYNLLLKHGSYLEYIKSLEPQPNKQ